MTFISYAQNFEDVMLWRAFKDVGLGFYIDVGAASPTEGSVTRAFYERGWRGINIEPEPGYAQALREQRPRDVNLQLAAGAAPGSRIIQFIEGTGLSTFDTSLAAKHAAAGFPTPRAAEVEVTTISSIWTTYAPAVVHFLKIDVEGAEREVLLGADLRRHRPWIIIVEDTRPFSPEKVTHLFDDLLLAGGYVFRWFDGLNAWYVANEHDAALAHVFEVPPNYFDNFVMGNYLAQASRADSAEVRLAETQAAKDRSEAHVAELDAAHRAQRRLVDTMTQQLAETRAAHQASVARMAEIEAAWRQERDRGAGIEARLQEVYATQVQARERIATLETAWSQACERADAADTRLAQMQALLTEHETRNAALLSELQRLQRSHGAAGAGHVASPGPGTSGTPHSATASPAPVMQDNLTALRLRATRWIKRLFV